MEQVGRYGHRFFFSSLSQLVRPPYFNMMDSREREGAWLRKTAAGGHASQVAPAVQTPKTSATNILSNWIYRVITRKEDAHCKLQLVGYMASKSDLFRVFKCCVLSALEIYSDLKPLWPLILHSSMKTEIKSVWCWTQQEGKQGSQEKQADVGWKDCTNISAVKCWGKNMDRVWKSESKNKWVVIHHNPLTTTLRFFLTNFSG